MLYERVGHPKKDKELLTAVSPVFHADQIVEALRKRDVEVEYMLKENEEHGFANEENSIEFYNAMVKFFDNHLK